MLRVEKGGPLKTSVSRKTAFEDDSSYVKLIVGWKEFAKSKKVLTSSAGISHREKMSSINLFQTNSLIGLASRSRSSKSAMYITEKATAILVAIAMP